MLVLANMIFEAPTINASRFGRQVKLHYNVTLAQLLKFNSAKQAVKPRKLLGMSKVKIPLS